MTVLCRSTGTMVEPKDTVSESVSDLQGKAVVVVGIGKSGVAASQLLQSIGARVTIADEKDESVLEEQIASLRQQSIHAVTGKGLEHILHDIDLVVLSPGVPFDHPALVAARERGVRIIGEIELASWFLDVPIIAVTGTNGKSTTVRLIGAILEESGKKVFVGGNLGIPLCDSVRLETDSASPYDYIVAEVSSFQLETIEQFRPWVAAMLNITPDHLDRHQSLSHYHSAKKKIFQNQTVSDLALLNFDDPIVAAMGGALTAEVFGFSLVQSIQQGVYVEGNEIKARVKREETVIAERSQIRLPGNHNLANVLAAVAIALFCGCPVEVIRRVISTFPGLEHAMEFVRELRGVKYYNDSKGTNVDATGKALESFHSPILLILGGKDKGGNFGQLQDLIIRKAKRVILIGESASRLAHVLKDCKPISQAGSLSEAVTLAEHEAVSGDVVLLSPACASFDMFRNYDERGKQFKKFVHQLV